jgi:hypothetical protein
VHLVTRQALHGRAEEGSALILSIIVMMILSTLSLAVLARTMSTMKFVRNGQDFDAALAAADAGLSDAVYVIQRSLTTATYTQPNTCYTIAPPRPVTCPTLSSYTYRLQYLNAAEYNVYSKGMHGQARHAIQARVSRAARFPFVLFSNSSIEINGSTSGSYLNFYSYNSVGLVPSSPPAIGSNGTVVCNGGLTGFTTHYVAGQTDCPGAFQETKPYDTTVTVPASSGRTCGGTGTPGGWGPSTFAIGGMLKGNGIDPDLIPSIPVTTIDGQNGTPIICNQDVRFYGIIKIINGPLKLYVTDHAVDIRDAVINVADLAANKPGRASDFQLFKTGSADFLVDTGNTADSLSLTGVISAPQTSITFNGGKWWTGSVLTNQMTINGTPNLKIGYDLDLANYLSDTWTVSRYRAVAPAAVGL